jgi:hypothetical protein
VRVAGSARRGEPRVALLLGRLERLLGGQLAGHELLEGGHQRLALDVREALDARSDLRVVHGLDERGVPGVLGEERVVRRLDVGRDPARDLTERDAVLRLRRPPAHELPGTLGVLRALRDHQAEPAHVRARTGRSAGRLDDRVVEPVHLVQRREGPRPVELHRDGALGERVGAVAEPELVHALVHQVLPEGEHLQPLGAVERRLGLVLVQQRAAGLGEEHVEQAGVAQVEARALERAAVPLGQRHRCRAQLVPGGRRGDAGLVERRLVDQQRPVVDQQRQAVQRAVDLHLAKRGCVERVQVDVVRGHHVVDRRQGALRRVERGLVAVPEHDVRHGPAREGGQQLLLDEALRDVLDLVVVLRGVERGGLLLELGDLVAGPGAPEDDGLGAVAGALLAAAPAAAAGGDGEQGRERQGDAGGGRSPHRALLRVGRGVRGSGR